MSVAHQHHSLTTITTSKPDTMNNNIVTNELIVGNCSMVTFFRGNFYKKRQKRKQYVFCLSY